MISRLIPSSQEALPVIGLGTWQTFDVASKDQYPKLLDVLKIMNNAGGTLIDSSPMYGRSETVIGDITSAMPEQSTFFYATKVWTKGKAEGIAQMEASMQKMKRATMDLIQVHNLVDYKAHLATLREWKEQGRVRYIGITHYTDDSHEELERVMNEETVDFVQLNYSILARHAEKRLLDAAAGKGVATLINRPFGEGNIFTKVRSKPLPDWAAENGMNSWSDFLLKYIISHPAVTCVIPATSDPNHATANTKAGEGVLPDDALRRQMAAYIAGL